MKLYLMSMEELERLILNEGEDKTLRQSALKELKSREQSLFGRMAPSDCPIGPRAQQYYAPGL